MKKYKIIHRITTGLLSAMALLSSVMYFIQYEEVAKTFTTLGYPTYIIYPLAIAKFFGVIALWSNGFPKIQGLAYAGFFYNFVLAASAHVAAGDGEYMPAIVGLLILFGSFWAKQKILHAGPSETAEERNAIPVAS